MMQEIARIFLESDNRQERIQTLSLVADILPLSEIREYLPGLSVHIFYKAKRLSRSTNKEAVVWAKKERYAPIRVNRFIEFITSPIILTGLPFGTKKVRTSSGKVVEIPNTIRKHRSTQVINMYYSYLEEIGEEQMKLSRSTLYRLLKTCAATRRESTTCVDYFIADAADAMDDLETIIETWHANQEIDSNWADYLKRGLKDAALYLRTDYLLHVKQYSRIADHCANHALSDSSDPRLSKQCDKQGSVNYHKHDLKCDRCDQVKTVFGDIIDTANKLIAECVDQLEIQKTSELDQKMGRHRKELLLIQKNEEIVIELKKHQLRASFTNQQRSDILDDLEEYSALITMDWAQKFLLMKFRERQSDYFGKRGISYHISHVTTKLGKYVSSHSFVHICKGDLQDSNAVTLILEMVLTDLRRMGIDNVIIRSDNAGCYHSSATLSSLHDITEKTGVRILRYSFSEAQNGKSSSDRVASHVKRIVKDYVDSGHDATTPEQFFEAIVSTPMRGLSAHLIDLTEATKSTTKFPGISSFFDFIVLLRGIQAYRYYGVGDGEFINRDILIPNSGVATILTEGGYTAYAVPDVVEDRNRLKTGELSEFWYTSVCVLTSACDDDDGQDKEEVIVDDSNPDLRWTTSDDFLRRTLFECPVEGCSSSFLSYGGLERHVTNVKHKIAPERVTIRDYTLNVFIRELEEVSGTKSIQFVADAVASLSSTDLDIMPVLKQGWALRTRKAAVRFSEDVKLFIEECFDQGLKQKRKLNPKEVEEMMANARHTDGSLRFSPEECINHRQITALFSRIASKRRSDQSDQSKRRKRSLSEEDVFETEGDLELEYYKEAASMYIEDLLHQTITRYLEEIFDTSAEPLIDAIGGVRGENQQPELQQDPHIVHDELFI